jgi:hypothetical protein
MIAMGKDVVKVTKSGWRPSKKGVEETLQMLMGKDLEDRIVILYGMDNSVFYEEDEGGIGPFPNRMKRESTTSLGRWSLPHRSRPRGCSATAW